MFNNFIKLGDVIKKLYNTSMKIYNTSNMNYNNTNMVGRWCHVNMPKCDSDKILMKIDFANADNNYMFYKTINIPKFNNNNKVVMKVDFVNKEKDVVNVNYTPQEYIDAFY